MEGYPTIFGVIKRSTNLGYIKRWLDFIGFKYSEQAKQVWKRFESDSQAKQVPMDNFLNQQYVDIGSTGNYVPRTGSKTPSQADDCQVNDIAKSLGHPEGFIFNVDTNMFTTNHSNTVQTVLPRLGLTEDSLFEKLETAMHNSFSG